MRAILTKERSYIVKIASAKNKYAFAVTIAQTFFRLGEIEESRRQSPHVRKHASVARFFRHSTNRKQKGRLQSMLMNFSSLQAGLPVRTSRRMPPAIVDDTAVL